MPPKAGIPVTDPQYKSLVALGRLKFIETGAGAPTHLRQIMAIPTRRENGHLTRCPLDR